MIITLVISAYRHCSLGGPGRSAVHPVWVRGRWDWPVQGAVRDWAEVGQSKKHGIGKCKWYFCVLKYHIWCILGCYTSIYRFCLFTRWRTWSLNVRQVWHGHHGHRRGGAPQPRHQLRQGYWRGCQSTRDTFWGCQEGNATGSGRAEERGWQPIMARRTFKVKHCNT